MVDQQADGYYSAYITDIYSNEPIKEVGLLNNTLEYDEHSISSDLERIFTGAMYALMEEL